MIDSFWNLFLVGITNMAEQNNDQSIDHNEFRLNTITNQFELISNERARSETRNHIEGLIKSKNLFNGEDRTFSEFTDKGIAPLSLESLYILAISVGVTDKQIFEVKYKINIDINGIDITLDLRDLDQLNVKSGAFLYKLIVEKTKINPPLYTYIQFCGDNEDEYKDSFLLLTNDKKLGSSAKFYKTSDKEYQKTELMLGNWVDSLE